MNKHLTAVILLTSLLSTSLTSFAWDLEKHEDGIKIYTQETQGSDFKAFRGEMTIKAALQDTLSVIKDVGNMDQWLHECTTSTVLEQPSENEIIVYQETNAPWPVSDRNFVLKMKVLRPNTTTAIVQFKALIEPEVPDTDCVRVTELVGSWTLKQLTPKQLHITYETSANPAGDIPAWLANAFVVDQPFNTLRNLRTRLSEQ